MYTIKLMNEFLHGPIWVYDEDGFVLMEFDLIDNDETLQRLNEEGMELYGALFSFDGEEPCTFDEEGYQKNYPRMVQIAKEIEARLNEINDGSFTIENYIKDDDM